MDVNIMDLPEGWVQESSTRLSYQSEGFAISIEVEMGDLVSIQVDDDNRTYTGGSYTTADIPLGVWKRVVIMAEMPERKNGPEQRKLTRL